MTATSFSAAPVAAASDDYVYDMQVHVPRRQIIEALTDAAVIGRWWTVVTGSERNADEVTLLMGAEPLIVFSIEHTPGTGEVTWAVTACDVLPDWVGTKPSFTVLPADDGTFEIKFRHVGLRPALECFDQCRAGWDHFMPSLHQFLETGEGRPDEPRRASA